MTPLSQESTPESGVVRSSAPAICDEMPAVRSSDVAAVPVEVVSAHEHLQKCCSDFERAVKNASHSTDSVYSLIELAISSGKALRHLRSQLSKIPDHIRQREVSIEQDFRATCASLRKDKSSDVRELKANCMEDIKEIVANLQDISDIARRQNYEGLGVTIPESKILLESRKHVENLMNPKNQALATADSTHNRNGHEQTSTLARTIAERSLWDGSQLLSAVSLSGILGLLIYVFTEMSGVAILLFLTWPVILHFYRVRQLSLALISVEASSAQEIRGQIKSLQSSVSTIESNRDGQLKAAQTARDENLRLAQTLTQSVAPIMEDCRSSNERLVECLRIFRQKSLSRASAKEGRGTAKNSDGGGMCPRVTRLGKTVAVGPRQMER